MHKLIATLVGFVAAAAAVLPGIVEAQHRPGEPQRDPRPRPGSTGRPRDTEEDTMHKLIATLVGFIAAAAAVLPGIVEASIGPVNHNETLVRDRVAPGAGDDTEEDIMHKLIATLIGFVTAPRPSCRNRRGRRL